MSHLEERLEKDLDRIRKLVAGMAEDVQTAMKNAVHALQSGNKQLAYATILADHPINRTMREVDRLCHSFIAVHLPSAGHLRFLSSVIRVNIELERIGDYAVTICREAVQLSHPPEGMIARELERLADETELMLRQSVAAFNELNADAARSTMAMADQIEQNMDAVYEALAEEGRRERIKDMLAVFVVFSQLKRAADQAKNLCEDTVFAATGDTKAPKVYHILFIDEDNRCQSQMAEAIARRSYPDSGEYSSAGRQPAQSIGDETVAFLGKYGIDLAAARPTALADLTPHEVADKHVIVSLQGPVSSYFDSVPFHTTALEWDVGPAPETPGDQRSEELYRDLALKIKDLMELLRGEEAS